MDNNNITATNLHTDDDTLWLEEITIGGFRVWHIMAFCIGTLLSIIIMLCCCMKFRIPRTKQEIEADFQRKQIIKKFREKLYEVKNSDMDDLDLPKALALIQNEFLTDESNSQEKEDKANNDDDKNAKKDENQNGTEKVKSKTANEKKINNNRLSKH